MTEQIAAPRAASYVDEKLKPNALVRGKTRTDLPEGASLNAEGVVLAREESFVLQDHDTVTVDEQGTLVRVEGQGGVRDFAPGTARLSGDVVKISDPAPRLWMKFEKDDVVELKGSYEAGEVTPTGGRGRRQAQHGTGHCRGFAVCRRLRASGDRWRRRLGQGR